MLQLSSTLLFLLIPLTVGIENAPLGDDPWDVDGPCQIYVEKFAIAQAGMVQCATNFSIPPKVCTNCMDEYINFKQVEYEMHHLQNVSSLDNRSCTEVIYNNYLLSYSYDISEALSSKIWDNSRCESCIHISWNFTGNDSRIEWLDHTVKFQQYLFSWRSCIENYKGDDEFLLQPNFGNGTICSACKDDFNKLFEFYWEIYVRPGIDFCVDVETTMNDTFHIWNDVWECADRKDRQRDTALVVITSCVMAFLIVLFYASSFIQGGGARRHLVQYSRLEPPRGNRSRLLSASTSDFSTMSPTGYVNPLAPS